MSDIENVIVIGSGPAGYTAALYTARANLHPLVIEGFAWGGLLQQTTDVENYPGFPEGILGPEMMGKLRAPAAALRRSCSPSRLTASSWPTSPEARTRSGSETRRTRPARSSWRWGPSTRSLESPGRKSLSGRGVSYCATCDAAFFKDAQTVIVGGGDSAMEEAIFLSKFASKVTIVHRRDEFRASKIMLERARAQANIDFLTPYTVREFVAGDNSALGHATLVNADTGEARELAASGTFVAIGHEPQSALVRGQIDLDENGYVLTAGRSTATNLPGVFAAGRSGRPHLPPGGHRCRLGLSGRSRRGVVPARHARADGAGGDAGRRPRAGAVGRRLPIPPPDRRGDHGAAG